MKQTRAERFKIIRDEILRHHSRMRKMPAGGLQLTCGPFTITYYFPGFCGPLRGHNLNIWPGAAIDLGMRVHGDKVCNVDWNQWDRIDIFSFRSGPWEEQLLSLLRAEDGVAFFG